MQKIKYLYLINIFTAKILIVENFDLYTEEELNNFDFTSYYAWHGFYHH